MRLKEIEQRLAAIRTELTTRGADMTDEEVATLEQEVTDLQEERKGLLAAQERRKKLLENIAAGNPVDDNGNGAEPTLLRNFNGANGAGEPGIDYLNITIFDVQEMPIDLYLYFMREANIHRLMQTKEGREYLDNCWRMEQTKPDRKKLREKMRKGER